MMENDEEVIHTVHPNIYEATFRISKGEEKMFRPVVGHSVLDAAERMGKFLAKNCPPVPGSLATWELLGIQLKAKGVIL